MFIIGPARKEQPAKFDKKYRRQSGHGPHKMLQIVAEADGLNAHDVVVQERGQTETERRIRVAGRGLQEKDQAENVRDKDERRKAPDDVEVFASRAVADDVFEQALEPAHDHLQEMLELARVVLAEALRGQREHDAADQQHQKGHDHVIGNVEPEGMPPDVFVERLVED